MGTLPGLVGLLMAGQLGSRSERLQRTSRKLCHRSGPRLRGQTLSLRGFPGAQTVKNPVQCRRPGFSPWVGKIPWRREWLPTPVSLAGESHGQRSLVGYSPWGRKEWATTE